MKENYKICKGVTISSGSHIEDYCLIGTPPRGHQEGDLATAIGHGAIIRSHTVIYGGNTIGDNFQTGNRVSIRELNQIGDNVSIGTASIIEHHVSIGNNVRMHSSVFVPEYTLLEDDVRLGPFVVLTNTKYPFSPGAKETMQGPTLRQGAILGANVTVLPGVTIGRKALIGAGAVVTKDVPDGAVVIGNPGRIVKNLSDLPY